MISATEFVLALVTVLTVGVFLGWRAARKETERTLRPLGALTNEELRELLTLCQQKYEIERLQSELQLARGLLRMVGNEDEMRSLKSDAALWRLGREQGLIHDELAQKLSFVWGNSMDNRPAEFTANTQVATGVHGAARCGTTYAPAPGASIGPEH